MEFRRQSGVQTFRARCVDELTDPESAYRFRDAARTDLLALHAALLRVGHGRGNKSILILNSNWA